MIFVIWALALFKTGHAEIKLGTTVRFSPIQTEVSDRLVPLGSRFHLVLGQRMVGQLAFRAFKRLQIWPSKAGLDMDLHHASLALGVPELM